MEKFDIFRLDGHTLRVFLSVCETRSISKTAELFDLNQSTISHTIDKMRAAVGDHLFVKVGRGIMPTAAALETAPKVQEILANIEGLVASGDYDAARDTTPINIAIPTPALMVQMRAVFNFLSVAAPNAEFRIARLAPRERLAEMLNEGEVDMAISINATKYPASLNATFYGTDDLVIYYDPAMRGPIETPYDYAQARHGVAGFGGTTKSIVEIALEELGLQRQVAFVSPTASTLGEFIVGTEIIATMPRGLADGVYSGLAYCEPPVPLPALRYDLVWHRRFDQSGRNTWIRNVVLDHA